MPDKLILACAGDGNISIGFRNILDAYQTLWNQGYRPTMDLNDFIEELRQKQVNELVEETEAS
jgi:hypothetical protein